MVFFFRVVGIDDVRFKENENYIQNQLNIMILMIMIRHKELKEPKEELRFLRYFFFVIFGTKKKY